MRKFFPAIIVIAFMVQSLPVLSQSGLTLRPYVRAGLNLTPPTLEELEYSGPTIGFEQRTNPIAAGAGAQVLMQRENLKIGLDVGAGSLFRNLVINDVPGIGTSNHLDQEFSIYTLALVEKMLTETVFVQGGAGLHFCPWVYEYYYESENYRDQRTYYSGVGTSFAIMLAVGTEIPISSNVNLFVLAKLDGIIRYGLMLPITGNIGLSFDL